MNHFTLAIYRARCFSLSAMLVTALLGNAAPLDPTGFPSLGANPFSTGTFLIQTNTAPNLPTLTQSGSATVIVGANSADGAVAVFVFDTVTVGSAVQIRAIGPRPVAILSRGSFDLLA